MVTLAAVPSCNTSATVMVAGKDQVSRLEVSALNVMGIPSYRRNFLRVIKLLPVLPLCSPRMRTFPSCQSGAGQESFPEIPMTTESFPRPAAIPNVAIPGKRAASWPPPGAGASRGSPGSSHWRWRSEQKAVGLRAALCLHPRLSQRKRFGTAEG